MLPGKSGCCWNGLPAPPAGLHCLTLRASTRAPPQQQPQIRRAYMGEGPPELPTAVLGEKPQINLKGEAEGRELWALCVCASP